MALLSKKPFAVDPLHEMTIRLAEVASGRHPPDLVITGARVLNPYTEKIRGEQEIWIVGGRIAALRPTGTCERDFEFLTDYYDARGGLIAPGLVDPHVHIESSMMTACAYAEAALVNGTTTVFCDSHEIANVCDADGIEWMLEDGRRAPLNVFLTVPSTVPATNARLETTGGNLTARKIGKIFSDWPEAVALGEKMDFVSVCAGEERSHAIIAEALSRGRPVCGHVFGREFVAAYAASGVTDAHEAITGEIAHDLLEAGLWVFLRGGPPGTPWNSLPEAIKAVTQLGAATKRVCVCTDDRDADDLLLFGLDWVVRAAAATGLPAPVAWSLGSLHPAERFGLDGELGGLGGGRRADLVLLRDDLTPVNTWFGGRLVVEDRKPTGALERVLKRPYRYPRAAYQTIRLPKVWPLVPPLPEKPCRANVIVAALPGITTYHESLDFDPALGWAGNLQRHGLCHLAVVERHGKSKKGGVGHGLLKDFGLREGAVASSVGHDAHNLVVAGVDEDDMRTAVEAIQKANGGVCVVRGGKVRALVPLPVAGLLSDKRAGVVARETTELKRAWAEAGCTLPYMGFNLLPLSVIPEARLTDKGIVRVTPMQLIPLFETGSAPPRDEVEATLAEAQPN